MRLRPIHWIALLLRWWRRVLGNAELLAIRADSLINSDASELRVARLELELARARYESEARYSEERKARSQSAGIRMLTRATARTCVPPVRPESVSLDEEE